jgi:Protein of unknown function (DUF3489)
MTTYSNRSNCARAAKKAGLEKFSIIEVDGKFGFEAPVAVKADKAPRKPRSANPAVRRVRRAMQPGAALVGANATIISLVTKGATISELMETLGWQAHSVRGSLSRLGKVYNVQRTKVGAESHYKIAS